MRERPKSGISQIAVAMVILALLTFTTVRTSPLYSGLEPGSSLSKITPKQRHLSVKEIAWTFPVLNQLAVVVIVSGDEVFDEQVNFSPRHFCGRYFSLPPPSAELFR